jgi:cysteinyl-tRNA synthetase
MSKKYLGLPLDVHGGGSDLIFPHHENETAQSEAAYGTTFCNAWMHGGMLQINSEKMSKSLGNFMLLREVLEYTKPQVLRMLMLQAHYRSPLDFSQERLDEAATSLERIENSLRNVEWLASNAGDAATSFDMAALEAAGEKLKADFIETMDDDFNTAGALGALFTFVGELNTAIADAQLNAADAPRLQAVANLVVELLGVFGIDLESGKEDSGYPAETVALAAEQAGYAGSDPAEAVQALLDARAAARKERNFAVADAIRDGLKALGLVIEDTPQGARISMAG